MFGFNWIDLIIIAILVDAFFRGRRIGATVELCTAGGFFAGLFLAGWLFPHLLPIHDRTLLTIVNGNLVLLTAIFTGILGYRLGRRARLYISKSRWRKLDSGFGIISIVSALIIVWLLAATIGQLPFAGFSNSANDSRIVQALDKRLPPVPAVLAVFNHQINPNIPPEILNQSPKPQASFEFSPADFQAGTSKATDSVVRITGFGCGGVEGGSGFVIAKDLVMTNAHVVAGVSRPIIKYDNQSYATVPVLFDANLDLAVLRAIDPSGTLQAPPLTLAGSDFFPGVTVAVIGYPDGYYSSMPGIIRDNLTVLGRNIYDVGVISRDTYGVQVTVHGGSSGSPIVMSDGQVVGIIFAKDKSTSNYAYALTSPSLTRYAQQAEGSYQRVNTGACLAN